MVGKDSLWIRRPYRVSEKVVIERWNSMDEENPQVERRHKRDVIFLLLMFECLAFLQRQQNGLLFHLFIPACQVNLHIYKLPHKIRSPGVIFCTLCLNLISHVRQETGRL